MKFNFKSTGYKVDNNRFKVKDHKKESIKNIPLGIRTPVSFGKKNTNLFEMNYNPIDQIKDNLRNLVQTNAGERLGRYNFGCSLSSLLFESISLGQEYEGVATKQIIDQVKKYIPILQIDNINFNVEKKQLNDTTSLAKINIGISFSVPRGQITNQFLEVILYAGG